MDGFCAGDCTPRVETGADSIGVLYRFSASVIVYKQQIAIAWHEAKQKVQRNFKTKRFNDLKKVPK